MAETRQNDAVLDPGRQKLGDIYARALLGATEKAGNTQLVLSEFDSLVRDVLDKLPQLDATLCSPRVRREERLRILDSAFRKGMSNQLLHFLKVVSKHGRLDCLRMMLQSAHRLYGELRGRTPADVRAASPVDEPLLEALRDQLQAALGREVDLRVKLDPKLIGGIVVRVGDTVYDGSVVNRLRQLRQEAMDRAAREIRGGLDRFTRPN